jgi:hypothetical protein
MNSLSVFINEQLVYEYDRSTVLDDKQQAFLDQMDIDMGRGFRVSGEQILEPDRKQRATFVAMNLVRALKQDDDAKIAVSCAYLSNRLSNTIEVHAMDQGKRINIEFIEDH